ncbi:MAG: NTP transferase domain-containing protein [Verrucomicrobiales bacterium]
MKILILAGGKSQRMGRNKALIERPDCKRQLDYLIELTRPLSSELWVSSNEALEIPPNTQLLPDLNPGDGPLGALASFHAANPDEAVLAIGCDHFLLDHTTLVHLIKQRNPATPATAFPNRLDHRPEPLCTIYEAQALNSIQASLQAKTFCARHFLETLQPTLIEPISAVALDNANCPTELNEAFAKLTHGAHEKTVKLLYFAKLRESRGLDEELFCTWAHTASGLYEELRFKHRLPLSEDSLRCARNGDFCPWSTPVQDGDEFVFIPPVAGG